MSKETTRKIGTIRYTDREREVIAVAVESDFFKVLEKKVMPQRLTKLAVTLVATGVDDRDLHITQGKSQEAQWLVSEMRRVADEYNKKNLDPDTEE